MAKNVLFIFTSLLLFSACVYGPKDPDRTFAEQLSGENYKSTNVIIGVPVLERKLVETKISGRVFCGEGISQVPANHTVIRLIYSNKVISTTTTDNTGNYSISAPLETKKDYELIASTACGSSKFSVSKSTQEQKNKDFYLKK